MMLMVSVQNLPEALEALKGGADIVDIKNLQEALVGSAHPMVAKEVKAQAPKDRHVSITLGVVPNQAGTVAMACYAAAQLQATSVKVGFMKSDYKTAVDVLNQCKRALEGSETKLIGSLFADNPLYGGLDAGFIIKMCKETNCDGMLIDTLTKDGRNLFDFMPESQLREIVLEGKEAGMSTALSGHLRIENLDELARCNPDIVGVRGAACRKGDRESAVHWEAVAEFKHQLELRKIGEILVHGKAPVANSSGWVVIDGRGQNCAGIIASLGEQIKHDDRSFVEVIISDVLNTYDLIVWSERGGHKIITQRKEGDGSIRILFQPKASVPAR
ncbi:MAG: hypothetical protein EXR67_03180 [Dehalococcoidia bacterium]|nr:hypothetical protein [Dehalococcoidia bacterium]